VPDIAAKMMNKLETCLKKNALNVKPR